MRIIVVACALLVSSAAFAIPPDPAATQPATKIQVDRLQSEITALRAELAAVEKEVHALEIAKASADASGAAPSKKGTEAKFSGSTFRSRAVDKMEVNKRGTYFDKAQANAEILQATVTDQAIAKYIASHDVTVEMQTAMYLGTPKPGMTEEQVKTFGWLDTIGMMSPPSEGVYGKTIGLQCDSYYILQISKDGTITNIELRSDLRGRAVEVR